MNDPTLPRSAKRLEEMLNDCSIDAIMAIDKNDSIIAWNTMAEKMHGKARHEVIGKNLFDIIPSMAKDEESLQAIEHAKKGIKSFVPASKKYYHRMHAENHFIPLKDNEKVTGVMNLVHDVAHRIKAEEQLKFLNEELEKRFTQLQKTSSELTSFAYISSNNIKQPIRHVYTAVENLIFSESARLTNGGRASFRRIQSSLSKMDRLLDDMLSLLQVSILEKPEEHVNLEKVTAEVIEMMANKISEKDATVTTENLCIVPAHEKHLHLLLHHLLDNAIKFNENKKPLVRVSCEKVLTGMNDGNDLKEKEYYKITVSDNGIGFNQADAERMFTMFEKLNESRYKGSGMGLAVARKIMDAHEGFIEAESHGAGAAIHCFFPVINQAVK